MSEPIEVLAIDPGPIQTGWCLLEKPDEKGTIPRVLDHGITPNHELKELPLFTQADPLDELAVEMVASYGMGVGADVFHTCVWIGRFVEAYPGEVNLIIRADIKMSLCKHPRAKDSNIRQSLIDLYGPGKEAAIGKKKTPGPLYGVKSHIWAALAVGVAHCAGVTSTKGAQKKLQDVARDSPCISQNLGYAQGS